MLLTITSTAQHASDLGFLLHKHPSRQQTFALNYGQLHVFYPQATEAVCTVAMLLEMDPVGLVRRESQGLDQYVNDRPYAASSFFSVGLTEVFREALLGKCKQRPEMVEQPLPLEATVSVVQCRGGEMILKELFEPLGYVVEPRAHPLDPEMGWNDANYYSLTLRCLAPLHQLLNHLYVLLPVLDNSKHYYVGENELEKLLRKGEGWLPTHPLRELIVSRYLKHQRQLTRDALARLQDEIAEGVEEVSARADELEMALEGPVQVDKGPARLHDVRLERVCEVLKESGARRVVDLGCGSGKLLRLLRKYRVFAEIVGMDVSYQSLLVARRRLKTDEGDGRIALLHGSLVYRDKRLQGFDGAALVEVIEHLDPVRLGALERNVFGYLRPATLVVTTPNQEYNCLFPSLPAGNFRHADHRFEWMRAEFQEWGQRLAAEHGYRVTFEPLGPEDPELGAPSQMAVFRR